MRRWGFLLPTWLSLSAASLLAQPSTLYQEVPAALPAGYGVLGVRVHPATPDTIAISAVVPRSPASRAGLRAGDRIIAALPYRLTTPAELSRYINSRDPGSNVILVIRRDDAELRATCQVSDVRELFFLMGEQQLDPTSAAQLRHQRWTDRTDRLEGIAESAIQRLAADHESEALVAALSAEGHRYAGDCRLHDAHYALRHPLKASQIALELAADLQPASGLDDLLEAAAAHLDLKSPVVPPNDSAAARQLLDGSGDPTDLDRCLLLPFFSAGLLARDAFAALEPADRRFLWSRIPELLQRFTRSFYLDQGDSSETAAHLRTVRLAKRVDLSRLMGAAVGLARLTEPAALQAIRRASEKHAKRLPVAGLPATFGGTFLYARQTAWGWVLVGGKGPNLYGEDAALVVDLGGDDTYLGRSGSPLFALRGPERRLLSPVGLVIDCHGDDRYIGNSLGSVGAAVGGVGLLADLDGDDLYQGGRLTQGAAFCGVGVLWDRRGDDVYLAQEGSQGAAFFGAGILLDQAGADLYSATRFSQGFGGPRGLGLLADRKGGDRYLADRQAPSSYGTEGTFQGWSQGVGCGFRGYASGGVGILLDASGDDDYQAGDFSQGTGYFFGLGLLVDHRGNDTYRGSRYAQGAGAHQAVGALVDGAGNDRYRATAAAAQGAAWDAAVGILEDRGGDDRYTARDLSQGAAAMNGVAVLFDWDGRDRYRAVSGQGHGGSVSYWGGRGALNLGILIDAGGDDWYSIAGRENGRESSEAGRGLFVDR